MQKCLGYNSNFLNWLRDFTCTKGTYMLKITKEKITERNYTKMLTVLVLGHYGYNFSFL